jgi:hypothetical protein
MVLRATLSCAAALVALAGCAHSTTAEPRTRTVTITATPTPAADPTPTEDPRCVRARSAVAGQLDEFWAQNVAPVRSYALFNMAIGSMSDLTNLAKNKLSTYGCVNDQYTNLTDAIAQVDQNSPLFQQQKAEVLSDIQEME